MKHYTKKAIKSGISTGIGFGIVTAGIDLYDRDDFELWKFIFKILLFTVFMILYFNYSLKKQSDKKS